MKIARMLLFLAVNSVLFFGCSPIVDERSVPTAITTPTMAQEAKRSDIPGDPITWNEIVFYTDAQANYEAARDEDQPRLSVISRQEDIAALEKWIRPEHLPLVQNVDFKESLVLIVFSGYRGQTGYGIEIHQVVKEGNTVTLSISFTEPPEGEPRGQIITSPYLILEIQKKDLPIEPVFILIANGKEIDQRTLD